MILFDLMFEKNTILSFKKNTATIESVLKLLGYIQH